MGKALVKSFARCEIPTDSPCAGPLPWRDEFPGAIVAGDHRAAEPLSLFKLRNRLPKIYPFFVPLLRACGQLTRMNRPWSGEIAGFDKHLQKSPA
jgi:hypothetical protein